MDDSFTWLPAATETQGTLSTSSSIASHKRKMAAATRRRRACPCRCIGGRSPGSPRATRGLQPDVESARSFRDRCASSWSDRTSEVSAVEQRLTKAKLWVEVQHARCLAEGQAVERARRRVEAQLQVGHRIEGLQVSLQEIRSEIEVLKAVQQHQRLHPPARQGPRERQIATLQADVAEVRDRLNIRRRLNGCLEQDVQTLQRGFNQSVEHGDVQVGRLAMLRDENEQLASQVQTQRQQVSQLRELYWSTIAPDHADQHEYSTKLQNTDQEVERLEKLLRSERRSTQLAEMEVGLVQSLSQSLRYSSPALQGSPGSPYPPRDSDSSTSASPTQRAAAFQDFPGAPNPRALENALRDVAVGSPWKLPPESKGRSALLPDESGLAASTTHLETTTPSFVPFPDLGSPFFAGEEPAAGAGAGAAATAAAATAPAGSSAANLTQQAASAAAPATAAAAASPTSPMLFERSSSAASSGEGPGSGLSQSLASLQRRVLQSFPGARNVCAAASAAATRTLESPPIAAHAMLEPEVAAFWRETWRITAEESAEGRSGVQEDVSSWENREGRGGLGGICERDVEVEQRARGGAGFDEGGAGLGLRQGLEGERAGVAPPPQDLNLEKAPNSKASAEEGQVPSAKATNAKAAIAEAKEEGLLDDSDEEAGDAEGAFERAEKRVQKIKLASHWLLKEASGKKAFQLENPESDSKSDEPLFPEDDDDDDGLDIAPREELNRELGEQLLLKTKIREVRQLQEELRQQELLKALIQARRPDVVPPRPPPATTAEPGWPAASPHPPAKATGPARATTTTTMTTAGPHIAAQRSPEALRQQAHLALGKELVAHRSLRQDIAGLMSTKSGAKQTGSRQPATPPAEPTSQVGTAINSLGEAYSSIGRRSHVGGGGLDSTATGGGIGSCRSTDDEAWRAEARWWQIEQELLEQERLREDIKARASRIKL